MKKSIHSMQGGGVKKFSPIISLSLACIFGANIANAACDTTLATTNPIICSATVPDNATTGNGWTTNLQNFDSGITWENSGDLFVPNASGTPITELFFQFDKGDGEISGSMGENGKYTISMGGDVTTEGSGSSMTVTRQPYILFKSNKGIKVSDMSFYLTEARSNNKFPRTMQLDLSGVTSGYALDGNLNVLVAETWSSYNVDKFIGSFGGNGVSGNVTLKKHNPNGDVEASVAISELTFSGGAGIGGNLSVNLSSGTHNFVFDQGSITGKISVGGSEPSSVSPANGDWRKVSTSQQVSILFGKANNLTYTSNNLEFSSGTLTLGYNNVTSAANKVISLDQSSFLGGTLVLTGMNKVTLTGGANNTFVIQPQDRYGDYAKVDTKPSKEVMNLQMVFDRSLANNSTILEGNDISVTEGSIIFSLTPDTSSSGSSGSGSGSGSGSPTTPTEPSTTYQVASNITINNGGYSAFFNESTETFDAKIEFINSKGLTQNGGLIGKNDFWLKADNKTKQYVTIQAVSGGFKSHLYFEDDVEISDTSGTFQGQLLATNGSNFIKLANDKTLDIKGYILSDTGSTSENNIGLLGSAAGINLTVAKGIYAHWGASKNTINLGTGTLAITDGAIMTKDGTNTITAGNIIINSQTSQDIISNNPSEGYSIYNKGGTIAITATSLETSSGIVSQGNTTIDLAEVISKNALSAAYIGANGSGSNTINITSGGLILTQGIFTQQWVSGKNYGNTITLENGNLTIGSFDSNINPFENHDKTGNAIHAQNGGNVNTITLNGTDAILSVDGNIYAAGDSTTKNIIITTQFEMLSGKMLTGSGENILTLNNNANAKILSDISASGKNTFNVAGASFNMQNDDSSTTYTLTTEGGATNVNMNGTATAQSINANFVTSGGNATINLADSITATNTQNINGSITTSGGKTTFNLRAKGGDNSITSTFNFNQAILTTGGNLDIKNGTWGNNITNFKSTITTQSGGYFYFFAQGNTAVFDQTITASGKNDTRVSTNEIIIRGPSATFGANVEANQEGKNLLRIYDSQKSIIFADTKGLIANTGGINTIELGYSGQFGNGNYYLKSNKTSSGGQIIFSGDTEGANIIKFKRNDEDSILNIQDSASSAGIATLSTTSGNTIIDLTIMTSRTGTINGNIETTGGNTEIQTGTTTNLNGNLVTSDGISTITFADGAAFTFGANNTLSASGTGELILDLGDGTTTIKGGASSTGLFTDGTNTINFKTGTTTLAWKIQDGSTAQNITTSDGITNINLVDGSEATITGSAISTSGGATNINFAGTSSLTATGGIATSSTGTTNINFAGTSSLNVTGGVTASGGSTYFNVANGANGVFTGTHTKSGGNGATIVFDKDSDDSQDTQAKSLTLVTDGSTFNTITFKDLTSTSTPTPVASTNNTLKLQDGTTTFTNNITITNNQALTFDLADSVVLKLADSNAQILQTNSGGTTIINAGNDSTVSGNITTDGSNATTTINVGTIADMRTNTPYTFTIDATDATGGGILTASNSGRNDINLNATGDVTLTIGGMTQTSNGINSINFKVDGTNLTFDTVSKDIATTLSIQARDAKISTALTADGANDNIAINFDTQGSSLTLAKDTAITDGAISVAFNANNATLTLAGATTASKYTLTNVNVVKNGAVIDLATSGRDTTLSDSNVADFRLLEIGKSGNAKTSGLSGESATFRVYVNQEGNASATLGGTDAKNGSNTTYGYAYSDRVIIKDAQDASTQILQIVPNIAKLSQVSYQGGGTETENNIAVATVANDSTSGKAAVDFKAENVVVGFDVLETSLVAVTTGVDGKSGGTGYTTYFLGKSTSKGSSEAINLASSSALSFNYDLYIANFNSLNKRMGELRDNPHSQGIWARVFNGAQTNNMGAGSTSNYTTVQAGYDYAFGFEGANNYLGFALSYAMSFSDTQNFQEKQASLGNNVVSLDSITSNAVEVAVYNSYVMDSGWYNDTIAKFSYIFSDFTLMDQSSKTTNYAFTLSDEFGYRFKLGELSEWTIDPQLEVGFGYFNQGDFNQELATIAGSSSLKATQDAILTMRARAGSSFGYNFKQFTQGKGVDASIYVGAFYEFDYFNGGVVNLTTGASDATQTIDNFTSDGRVVVNVGTNVSIQDNTRLYFDFEKSFAGEITTDYQINFGVRYSFGENAGYMPINPNKKSTTPLKVSDENATEKENTDSQKNTTPDVKDTGKTTEEKAK